MQTVTLKPGETLDVRCGREAVRPLDGKKWDALRSAEERIYRTNMGANAYTDVNENIGDPILSGVWDLAQIGAESAAPTRVTDQYGVDEGWLYRETARRVAMAYALINFGPEILFVS